MAETEHIGRKTVKAVFFDLDGTIMATACDLAAVLNGILKEHNLPAVPLKKVEEQASNGVTALLQTGFSLKPSHPDFKGLRQRYLSKYQKKLQEDCTTPLYPGIKRLLETLEHSEILWGIVTNKPRFLTLPLLQKHGLVNRSAAIICPEDVNHVKPSPEPLLKAAEIASVPPRHCIYVGDHERDIQAGRAAGMLTFAAAYGHIEAGANPENWQATMVINHPEEIITWLQNNRIVKPNPFLEKTHHTL